MLAMSKSATVFVNYLASHANENAQAQNRKTIAPQDVFKALEDLEFPEFRPRLEAELAKFSQVQTDKRNTYRAKVAADKAAGRAGSPHPGEESFMEGEGESQLDAEGQPVAKKARREPAHGVDGEGRGLPEASALMEESNLPEEEDTEEDAGQEEESEGEGEEENEREGRLDVEEPVEEPEEREPRDEALDNGEDSD